MRRVRLTYEGAFHHCMNRGIKGESIFEGSQNKAFFLDFLEEATLKYPIRILAYCVMDNHYHLILQNNSGKLSDFFRHLNSKYGTYYRTFTTIYGVVADFITQRIQRIRKILKG